MSTSSDTAIYNAIASSETLSMEVTQLSVQNANTDNYLGQGLASNYNAESKALSSIYNEMKSAPTSQYGLYQTNFQQVQQEYSNFQTQLQNNVQSIQTTVTQLPQFQSQIMQFAGVINGILSYAATLLASNN
ncbi:MAG: hypothetical protein H7A38_06320 [Chlamydiales bacterium]|nr:hypothetical protein [Chlamydiales bacterium]